MSFVLDASVAAGWMLKDEKHPEAAFAFARLLTDGGFVPSIWWYEVRNLLVVSERRGRLTRSDVETLRVDLVALPVSVEGPPEEDDNFEIAWRHSLTFYDAAYIELARRKQLPLASLDNKMRAVAQLERVSLLR